MLLLFGISINKLKKGKIGFNWKEALLDTGTMGMYSVGHSIATSKPAKEAMDEVTGAAAQRKAQEAIDKNRKSYEKQLKKFGLDQNPMAPQRTFMGSFGQNRRRRSTLLTGAQGLGEAAIQRKTLLGQ